MRQRDLRNEYRAGCEHEVRTEDGHNRRWEPERPIARRRVDEREEETCCPC